MERRTLILLSLALVAVVATLFYLKADRAVDSAGNRAAENAFPAPATLASSASGTTGSTGGDENVPSTTPRPVQSLPPVQNQMTNAQAMRRDMLREIQTLENNLSARRQRLEQQEGVLAQLRTEAEAELTEQTQNANSSTQTMSLQSQQSDLRNREQEVLDLKASLEEMRATREALLREEEDAIVLRENANKLAIAQIDAELLRAEDDQAATRARLEKWARDKTPVNGPVPPNPELDALFSRQQQQIDSLREQRLALTTDLHVQADAIYNLSQQARSQLRAEEQNVRSRIFSLQSEIRRAQQSQAQVRRSEQSRASRLRQAQQNLQAEAQAVRTLEASLREKQEQLRSLRE